MRSAVYEASLQAEQERRAQIVRLDKIMFFERKMISVSSDEEKQEIQKTLYMLRYGADLLHNCDTTNV